MNRRTPEEEEALIKRWTERLEEDKLNAYDLLAFKLGLVEVPHQPNIWVDKQTGVSYYLTRFGFKPLSEKRIGKPVTLQNMRSPYG